MSVHIRIRNGMMPDGEGNGGASEGDIRGDLTDIIDTEGVVDVAGGHLLVHEADSPDMNVIVDAGVGYIPNDSFDETDSDSIKFWEAVVAGVTGERTLAISSNSSGQTRVDLVCVKIDPGASPDYYASDIAELIIVEGTPGSGAPSLPNYHLKLAEVTVVNGATEIENEDIEDTRTQIKVRDALLPEGVVTESGAQTLTGKRITKRIQSISSSATPTPDIDSYDELHITALAAGATIGAPTGTPTNGQGLVLRIKDNGTARALAFNAIYRFSTDIIAPTTTVISKTMYLAFKYNSADDKYDCVAFIDGF